MPARLSALLALTVFALAGCRTATVSSDTSTAQKAPPPAATIPADATELPVGTVLRVEVQDELSTEQSKVGDDVRATLTAPVQDSAGKTLVPAGAPLTGKVTELSPSERVGEPASITLAFTEIEVNGQEKPLQADITDADPELSRNWGRAGKGAGIGAAGGAVLGAVLGRSVKGAVIGGVVGAAAGTAISLGTGEEDAKLPAGTPMTLALTQPVPLK